MSLSDGTVFANNSALAPAGGGTGLVGAGGALVLDSVAALQVRQAQFVGNRADSDGGAIYLLAVASTDLQGMNANGNWCANTNSHKLLLPTSEVKIASAEELML